MQERDVAQAQAAAAQAAGGHWQGEKPSPSEGGLR